MEFFVISDNHDTYMGMRLAGMDGVVVHGREEALKVLDEAVANESIGIILMTTGLIELCSDVVFDIKLNRKYPLIVEVPDRQHTSQAGSAIDKYISEAIGIKI